MADLVRGFGTRLKYLTEAEPSAKIGNDSTSTSLVYMLDETVDEFAAPGEKNQGDFPTSEDVRNAIIEILGYTSTEVGDGRIGRILPIRHPWPGLGRLWAQELSIAPAAGSRHEPEDDANATPDAPSAGGWALHRQYVFDVSFTRRRYAVLPDRMITKRPITWYDYDGEVRVTQVWNEWDRWTDIINTDREDIITATVGTAAKFKTAAGLPNDVQFNAQTSLRLPNSTVKLHFYQVPYRYVTHPDSFLKRLKGTINQLPFLQWGVGELLYLGYTWNKNDKPITIEDDDGLPPMALLDADKLCDIEMMFILAEGRRGTSLPAAPINKNFVMAGHNLQPWLQTKRYYYVVNGDADETPNYLSAPHQLLFQDPQVVIVEG